MWANGVNPPRAALAGPARAVRRGERRGSDSYRNSQIQPTLRLSRISTANGNRATAACDEKA
jgi:hypothetical protein